MMMKINFHSIDDKFMTKLISYRQEIGLIIVLLASAIYSSLLGYVSPDSWKYLKLAQSILHGEGCSIRGDYFAVFPCGYPITLAMSAFSTNLETILLISKFTNVLLLFLSFLLLSRLLINSWAPFLVVIAPSSLLLSHYTWSENLFLFSLCLTLFCFNSIAEENRLSKQIILISALIMGIASRYFFAPYAFLLWISVFVIYGRKVALQTLPALLIAGLFFIAYYAFNQYQTGFGTGMQRLATTESLLYLFVNFVIAIFTELWKFLLIFVVFLFLSRKSLNLDLSKKSFSLNNRPILMIALAGVSFLILTFALRAHTQIEMYSPRTIAYGVTLLIVGIGSLFVKFKIGKGFTFNAVILVGFLSLYLSDHLNFNYIFHGMTFENYNFKSVTTNIKNYKAKFYDDKVDAVVTFYVPEISQSVARDAEQYYGSSTELFFPYKGPRWIPETLTEFKMRLSPYIHKNCVVDFTNFENMESFKKVIYSKTIIDYRFNMNSFSTENIGVLKYDRELADFFSMQFKPAALIPCSELFHNKAQ